MIETLILYEKTNSFWRDLFLLGLGSVWASSWARWSQAFVLLEFAASPAAGSWHGVKGATGKSGRSIQKEAPPPAEIPRLRRGAPHG